MPNGVSCAFFAVRNHIVGQNEDNMFKEGIAGCQTVRTLDAVAASSIVKDAAHIAPPTSFIGRISNAAVNSSGVLGKAAKLARKVVYPLIIASGVYNTVTADDKVKTGAMNAGGIITMYSFEQLAETLLKQFTANLLSTKFVSKHKLAQMGVSVVRGLAFVGASLLGYTIGSKGSENLVDNIRLKKSKDKNSIPTKNVDQEKNNIFSDMMN